MNKLSAALKDLFTPGTPACAVVYALLGIVLATLLLTIGFWKTLFLAVFAAAGALIGGIGNKQDAVRKAVNKRFPAKDEPLRDEHLKETLDKILEKEEQSDKTE